MLVKKIRQEELDLIHEKSLYILEHVGVIFEQPELVAYFEKLGLKTDGQIVYFDRATVEKAIESSPASFVLETPYEKLKIGEGGISVSTASGATKILRDGELVTPTLQDYIDMRKLDATNPAVNLSSSPLTYIAEFPEKKADLIKAAYTLEYSKHPMIASCAHKQDAVETIELARQFYGVDHGYYVIGVGNVISPLRYDSHQIEAILSYTTRNLPVVIACCSSPGLTSPITVGGTIVQNNAEVLAGVVMTQLVNPGCPVVYGNVTYGSDMRYAEPFSWTTECAVITQYSGAMARYYKLPCRIGGSLSVAKELDWQDGAQTAISLMTTMDSGSDFVFHACGELDSLNVFSFEKYVLDEEVLLQRLMAAEREYITEDGIIMESILEVGPGGNYLSEDETVELYSTEFVLPKLFNMSTYDRWRRNGSPKVVQRAKELVEKRLASYVKPEWTKEQMAILENAKKY